MCYWERVYGSSEVCFSLFILLVTPPHEDAETHYYFLGVSKTPFIKEIQKVCISWKLASQIWSGTDEILLLCADRQLTVD